MGGIGMCTSRIGAWAWYWFPWSAVQSNVPLSIYGAFVRLCLCFINTAGPVYCMKRHMQYKEKKHKAMNAPLSRVWLKAYTVDIFVRSLPFCFAYQWSQLTYEVYFHAIFDCTWPFLYCGKSTLWMWFCYTAIFAFVAFQMVPNLQSVSMVMRRLDKFYTSTLLKDDRDCMREQRITNELFTV